MWRSPRRWARTRYSSSGWPAAAVGSLGADRIPEALTGLVTPVLESAARSLTTMPGYPDAWTETLRKSHRLNFADPGDPACRGRRRHLADPGPCAPRRPGGEAGGGCHDPAAGGPGPAADHHRAARAPAGPRPGGRFRADGLRRGRRCPDRVRPGLRGRPSALDCPGRYRARNAGAGRRLDAGRRRRRACGDRNVAAATKSRRSSRASLSARPRRVSGSGSWRPPWLAASCWQPDSSCASSACAAAPEARHTGGPFNTGSIGA